MTWRMARSLDTLLKQINDLAPNRSKASDGGIGDPNHSARTSDHNPDAGRVVRARDFTDDPSAGFDASDLADRLLKAQDPRLKYVISDGRIGSGPAGRSPGVWRSYDGPNAHRKHCHVSVVPGPAGDLTAPWAIGPTAPLKPTPVQEDDMPLTDADIRKLGDDLIPRLKAHLTPAYNGGTDVDPGAVTPADVVRSTIRIEQAVDALVEQVKAQQLELVTLIQVLRNEVRIEGAK